MKRPHLQNQLSLTPVLLSLMVIFSACAMPTTTTPGEVTPSAAVATITTADTVFPLTITDAAGQEFTFDAPPKIGCWWTGCTEVLADLGVAPHAASTWLEEGYDSPLFFPAGSPLHEIVDTQNPENWAAAEVDLLIMRVPASPDHDAMKAAAPIFYLHHPSYGESGLRGYEAYLENVRIGGQLTGKPAEAEAAIARFEHTIANLKLLATPETQAQTVVVLWENEAYRALDSTNPFCIAIAEASLGTCIEAPMWDEINAETFLAADPDVILFMSGSAIYQERTDPIWHQLTAVKEGRVYGTTGLYYCCGARAMIHSLQEYAHLILPAAVPNPGPMAAFVIEESPLVQEPATAAAETAQTTDSRCEAGFHLFDHEYLATEPVCIPANPQRVVAADAYVLETILALGIKPIGSSSIDSFSIEYPELSVLVEGVEDTGNPLNLETLLALKPDLIIAIEPWVAENYDLLAQIAPVVSIDFDEILWDGFVDLMGNLLDRPAQMAELLASYQGRVAALQEAIAAKDAQGTFSMAQFYNEVLRLYPIEFHFPYLFPGVGLASTPEQIAAFGDEWRIEVSKEELQLFDTDYIFLVTYATNADEVAANQAMVARLEADPLWQQLPAAQNGQVFVVPFYWNAGAIYGQHKMLDDLFQHIVQVDPATVAPNPFRPAQ